jgi:hypothetical protein
MPPHPHTSSLKHRQKITTVCGSVYVASKWFHELEIMRKEVVVAKFETLSPEYTRK